MNKEKIISLILPVMLLLASSFTAFAAEEAAQIKISVETFTVTVEVTTKAEGEMTAILKNKDNNVWVDMSQTRDFTVVDGKNVYTFQFVMQPTRETGDYVVTVGGNVAETMEPFTFRNIQEIADFYNLLNEAKSAEDEIYSLLTGEKYILYYDLTAYMALGKDTRTAVDKEIEGWDLSATIETVSLVNQEFTALLNRTMSLAQIADPNTGLTAWDEAVKTAIDNKDADGKYYGRVKAETVRTYFNNETISGIKAEDVSNGLDGAFLLAVAKELDFATLGEAFDFYLDKGTLEINGSSYEKVKKAGL